MSTYMVPTPDQVAEAIRRTPTVHLRRVFYEGLQNPNWVEPLRLGGAFADPPEPTTDESGNVREVYWPEIDYLIRVAPAAPTAVVDVLLTLKASTNSWVRRGLFAIGRIVPAAEAARLKPVVSAWGPSVGWRTDPHDLAGMTRNLLDGGELKFGRSMANLLFRPRHGDSRNERTTLEEYWYAEELPGVVEALGDDALTVVLPWLVLWEEITERYTVNSDATPIGRSDIASRDENYPSVEHSLIDAVRDVALERFPKSPEATATALLRPPQLIVRKIALYAAAQAVETAGKDVSPGLLAAGRRLLEDRLSSDHNCRVEFADLFIALRSRGADVDDLLRGVLSDGPFGDRAILVERLARWRDSGEDVEALADEHTVDWQQRLLATIGPQHLPEDLRAQLAAIDGDRGPIESPREPDFKFTSFTGPVSPATREELDALPPMALADYLESWRSGDEWMGPSHEGMGRLLTEIVTDNPEALAGVTDLVGRVRPLYLRAIIRGWHEALRKKRAVNWSEALALVAGVLEHPDASEIEPEGREFDDDHDYVGAKQAATSFLTDAARPGIEVPPPPETLADIARLLIATFDDDDAWTRYASYTASSDSDPLTISLNWQWPIMLRGIVNLVGHGAATPWSERTLAILDAQLQRDDPRGATYSVIGEGFGRLYNSAKEWLLERVPTIFGSPEALTKAQQIALTTTLATQQTHRLTLEALRGPLQGAMRLEAPIAMGWNGNAKGPELLGQWIITCLIWGAIEEDDPLVRDFFSLLPAEVRGKSVGHIAWSFMHSKTVDPDIRERFQSLWDRRVAHVRESPADQAELADFYWFVRSGKFEREWWLPRLREAVELSVALNTHGMIGEELASAAQFKPREAFELLRLLFDRDTDDGMSDYDLNEHAAPGVIAAALDAGDRELAAEATRFMNDLGARGHINLEKRVNELRRREP